MKKLLVIGAGGHGKVVADTAQACGTWQSIGLLDDRFPELRQAGAWKVVGTGRDWQAYLPDDVDLLVGIGDNQTRLRLQTELVAAGYTLPVLVHPHAWVSPDAQVEAGTVIFAGGVVNAGALIGEAAIINTAATVDHDCSVGAGVHLSPGVHLGGNVTVGRCSWLGIGAVVRHGLKIGAEVMVGAGAAVVAELPDGVTAVGVPARLQMNPGT